MGIRFERKFLRPDELLQRWQCSEADLKYEVIEGKLAPIIFVDNPMRITDRNGRAVFGPDEWYASPDVDDLLGSEYLNRGYLILKLPIREGIDTCSFSSFSRHQDVRYEGVWLTEGMFPLENYWSEIVFDLPSILSFETERTQVENSASATEKPLGTTERDTLLKLVIGMAIDGYGHDPSAAKSKIPKEIAGILTGLNMPVSDDTVRKFLKQATDLVLPAKPRQ